MKIKNLLGSAAMVAFMSALVFAQHGHGGGHSSSMHGGGHSSSMHSGGHSSSTHGSERSSSMHGGERSSSMHGGERSSGSPGMGSRGPGGVGDEHKKAGSKTMKGMRKEDPED